MKDKDIKHLEWIYARMVEVHKENPHYDYMNKFREIIDYNRYLGDEKSYLFTFYQGNLLVSRQVFYANTQEEAAEQAEKFRKSQNYTLPNHWEHLIEIK